MIKTKSVQVIDLQDWDDLVEKTYNKPYSFQQQDGCKQRGTHYITIPVEYPENHENESVPDVINGEEMGVSFEAWLARDVDQWNGEREYSGFYKNLFWGRNFYPHVDMVANDLYLKGLIAAGEYVIEIDW